MTPLHVNQNVITPNGPGVVEGRAEDAQMFANGAVYIRVRHTLAQMTSRAHGICATPKAQISGVWYYERQEIT